MTEILLGILILLAVINLILTFRSGRPGVAGSGLKEVEQAIGRFEAFLEKNERTLREEFERNRRENQETALANREELTRSLRSFEEKFAVNINELGAITWA